MTDERWLVPAAVHVLLMRNQQVLMLRRFQTGYADGMYSLPAGHLDGGESVSTAAARELREETGIVVHPALLSVVHVMHRFDINDSSEWVNFFLLATSWYGQPVIAEPDKCDRLTWSAMHDLPVETIQYVSVALTAIQRGVFYSEIGWKAR